MPDPDESPQIRDLLWSASGEFLPFSVLVKLYGLDLVLDVVFLLNCHRPVLFGKDVLPRELSLAGGELAHLVALAQPLHIFPVSISSSMNHVGSQTDDSFNGLVRCASEKE